MKHSWKKLIIDGKQYFVFPSSKIPAWVKRKCNFRGINLEDATRDERKPFLGKVFRLEKVL